MSTKEQLWTVRKALRAAFDAGFEASGEGYNGEYLHPTTKYPECNDERFERFLEASGLLDFKR